MIERPQTPRSPARSIGVVLAAAALFAAACSGGDGDGAAPASAPTTDAPTTTTEATTTTAAPTTTTTTVVEEPEPAYPFELVVADVATPPGDGFDAPSMEYATAWAAKEICTRTFVADADPQTTIDNEATLVGAAIDGFDIATADIRIDEDAREVTIEHPGVPARRAVHARSQGCVIVPPGADDIAFEPVTVEWAGPAADEPWPLGETVGESSSPIDRAALSAAIDAHMERAGIRGVAVVHESELVDERYADGFGPFVPQRGWSTGKSLAAAAIGRMVDQGLLDLDAPVPVAAWADDERSIITLRNLVNMSSGLDQVFDDDVTTSFSPANEHAFIYVEGFDVVADAVEVEPGMFEPGEDYAYRNANPLIATALARLAYETEGGAPFEFLAREIFEPLGMRSSLVETDPYGNFLTPGAFYTTPRDLARLTLAHMDGGVLGGERVLSQEWADFSYAPSAGFSCYGAFWRNNLASCWELPEDAFFAAGGFGQRAVGIPSRGLVITSMAFDPFTGADNFEALVADVVALVDAAQ